MYSTCSIVANNPPRISGPNTLFVVLEEETQLTFNVTDDKNNFTVSVPNGLPMGATLTSNTVNGVTEYTFSWTLYELVDVSLIFEARDELNAVAVLNVQVQICACKNGGNCTLEGLLSITNETVVLNCQCPDGKMFYSCKGLLN